MREIKFRGKDAVTGEWFYGYYNQTRLSDGELVEEIRDMVNDYPNYQYFRIVDPSTVGQYTGLKDKNYQEIYEGDILRLNDNSKHEVIFSNACYFAKEQLQTINDISEVIGNIHDNPEMIDL